MSAFICSEKHVNTIVSYAAENDISVYIKAASGQRYWHSVKKDPILIAKILKQANVDSVNHRYNESDKPSRAKYKPEATAFISPIQIVKLCNCFDYQSCEVDDYDDSDAARIINSIRSNAITNIPGYNDAAWAI